MGLNRRHCLSDAAQCGDKATNRDVLVTPQYGRGTPLMYPPITMPVYGLVNDGGPRWLDGCAGTIGEPPTRVSLAYGSSPWPMRGRPWIRLTTVGDQRDAAALARLGLFTLMTVLAPTDPARHRGEGPPSANHRRFWRNSITYLNGRAERAERWTPTTWTVSGEQRTARFARFAGGWTAFVNDLGAVGLVAVAKGFEVHALAVEEVTDGEPYHFDLAAPITWAGGHGPLAVALGPVDDLPEPYHPIHADQRRLL